MEAFDLRKVFEEMMEGRLELVTLRFVKGTMGVCSAMLPIHPGCGEVIKVVALAEASVQDRIASISARLMEQTKNYANAIALMATEPTTEKPQ